MEMIIKTYPIPSGTMLKDGKENRLFATDDEATEYMRENNFEEVLQKCITEL